MRRTRQSLLAVTLVLATQDMATAQLNRFAGDWRNTDTKTGGVTALQITINGETVKVRAWGKASPKDHDFGEVAGYAYAPNAGAKPADSAQTISAVYKDGSAERLLIVHLTEGADIRAEWYTRFTARGKRSAYVQTYTFKRSAGQQAGAEKPDEAAPGKSKAPPKADEIVVGQPFPAIEFKSLEGKRINISELKGKVVLIDFWATWCGPCRQEMPNVLSAYQKYHEKGFEVIGISLEKDRKQLEGYIEENKIPWPQYFDGKGWQNELAKRFGIEAIPSAVLLDKQGNVRFKDIRGVGLDKAIASLL